MAGDVLPQFLTPNPIIRGMSGLNYQFSSGNN